MKKYLIALVLAISLTGCTQTADPVVETAPVSFESTCQDTGLTIISQTPASHETVYTLSIQGADSVITVIQCDSDKDASELFDQNVQTDQAENMTVMEQAQKDGYTVKVIRNNRANQNYVDAMHDTTVIHIANLLPQQLTPTLDLLGRLGYPQPEMNS